MKRMKAHVTLCGEAVITDVEILRRTARMHQLKDRESPAGIASTSDVMGTLAVNLRVLANALDEEREGRLDFRGCLPSEALLDAVREPK